MRIARLLGSIAVTLGVILASAPVSAQQKVDEIGVTITTTPAFVTDYRFRGISQTRRDPAVQVTLDIEHESGIYVSAFVSNVKFPGIDADLEIDAQAGIRFELAGFKFDIGGVYYAYPGYTEPPGGFSLNYAEVAARVSREFEPVTVLASVYYSPDYQANSGHAVYVEGGVDVKLPYDFILSGRLGYQVIQRNPRFGAPDFANWSVVLSRDLFGFTFALGYYDTSISRDDCFGQQNLCAPTALASISRKF